MWNILCVADTKNLHFCFADTLEEWRCLGKKGVWIKIPLKRSELISPLSDIGFKCHHAKEDYIMMTYWLCDDEPNKLPKYSFHQVGVSGIIFSVDFKETLSFSMQPISLDIDLRSSIMTIL